MNGTHRIGEYVVPLTPQQMRDDLVLVPAEGSEPFREHITRW
jgi:hypothetical protein